MKKKSFLEEMWLNITYSQVPSPGVMWTWVSVVWVLLHLSVCALFGWAVHTSAANRGWPLEQMSPIVVHISLVTVLPAPCLCILPASMARAHSRDCCWSHGSMTRVALSLHHSGIAGLSWGCCSVHFAVLHSTSDLVEERLLLLFRGKLLTLC